MLLGSSEFPEEYPVSNNNCSKFQYSEPNFLFTHLNASDQIQQDRWGSEYFSNDFDILDHCDLELMLGTDVDTYNSEIIGCDGDLNNDILFDPLRILEYIRLVKLKI
ncbi:hypothetical protein LOAG_13420 [Loa loa]|uniref:Uncharacterized protein n=1 Tax=Loa loa TaxID=7209 RepID=A0A1S0TJJ3_LOALO|nr:hypothetical protein LOAG_13420 [Loa loa]EFO15094.1 hypothetical protein LOAG_13420 [Loa loa]